jgi:nucleoside phosphorylase
MVGLIFTTAEEAAPFVEQYAGRRPDEVEEGAALQTGDVLVIVTGPGKIKATLGTEQFLRQHDVDVLVHAGGAAVLTDEIEVGALVGATFVLEGDRVALDAPAYPRMPLDSLANLSTEGTLVSQDHTDDEDTDEQSYWERLADLRDETGYAVAYVAAQHGVPCHIVKGITHRAGDDVNPAERQEVYEGIATFLQDYLESLGGESES